MQKILLVGTNRKMASGVSTHINQLFNSSLNEKYQLDHFTVGSFGTGESKVAKLWRFLTSPISFFVKVVVYRPNIVHLNPSMDFKGFFRDAVYLMIAKCLGKTVVLQLHAGLKPQVFFDAKSLLAYPRKWILWMANAVILLTDIEYRHAKAFTEFKLLTVVPNAIDLSEFRGQVKQLTVQDKISLIYIGRLVESKGVVEGIKALALLKGRGYNNLQFKVAGSGPFETALKTLVNDLGVSDSVSFLGGIYGDEKQTFWNNAHILVFPTYFDEGLPYTLLEALASGTPVITTEVGGIPEVIVNGKQGLFVPPQNPEAVADAILKLISDPSLFEDMSSACLARAREAYGLERLAKQVGGLYEQSV